MLMNAQVLTEEISEKPLGGEPKVGSVGKRLTINSIVGIVTQLLNLASRIIITPFVLAYISLQEYGLWTICFVILSYAGLSAFGVNNAYVKYVAEYQARKDYQKINELLSTGIICMSALCLALYVLLATSLPFILEKFAIGTEFEDLATTLILGTALAFLIEIGLGGFKGLLEGFQEIALTSYVFLAMGILEVILIIILLPLGFGIKGMLYAYIVKTILLVALLAIISFRKFKGLKVGFSLVRRESLNHLLIFGGKIQLMGLMSIFIETFDRVVSTSLLGLAATGMIEVGRKFPNTARGFSGPAFAPFIPAASYLGGWWEDSQWPTLGEKVYKYGRLIIASTIVALLGILPLHFLVDGPWEIFSIKMNPLYLAGAIGGLILVLWLVGWMKRYKNLGEYFVGDDVRNIFLKGSRHINLINFIVFTFLIITADRLIFAWLGPGYETAVTIVVLVSLSNLIHQGTGPGTSIFRGVNRSGREFEYTLVQFILVLFWIPAMTAYGGVIGAALGFSLSAVIASFYFYWRSFKAFRIPFWEALRIMVIPGLAPIVAGLIIRLVLSVLPGFSRWQTIFALGISGVLYLALTLIFLKKWFLTPEEWDLVGHRLEKFTGRFFSGGPKLENE
jgi:O-antigen/teichoic acid export membrane protein